MPELTADLWLQELAEAQRRRPDDPGLCLWELAEMAGVSTRTMNLWLRQAHRKGLVKVGRKESVSIVGRRTWIPVYTILPAKRETSSGRKTAVKRKAARV